MSLQSPIAIALTAWRRYGELVRTIESINAAEGSKDAVVGVGIDYESNKPIRDRIIRTVQKLTPTVRHELKQKGRRGKVQNLVDVIDTLVECGPPKVIVILDDDTTIAPDTLRLASWFANLESRDAFMALTLGGGPYGNASPSTTRETLAPDDDESARFPKAELIITPLAWKDVFRPAWTQKGALDPARLGISWLNVDVPRTGPNAMTEAWTGDYELETLTQITHQLPEVEIPAFNADVNPEGEDPGDA
jgi:hypothetical protein